MTRSQSASRGAGSPLSKHAAGEFRDMIRIHPVIPAIRSRSDVPHALRARSKVVYLLAASLSNLDEYLHTLRQADKEIMVNLDLFAGLSRDAEAVAYLGSSGCAGIISTHTNVLGLAMSHGLFAVQRTFLIDSDSIISCMRSLKNFVPDALELLPAVAAPRILPQLREHYGTVATVGGGLIADLQEADSLIRQGLDAVSIGNSDLWGVG